MTTATLGVVLIIQRVYAMDGIQVTVGMAIGHEEVEYLK
jgi:hypothetical protein